MILSLLERSSPCELEAEPSFSATYLYGYFYLRLSINMKLPPYYHESC